MSWRFSVPSPVRSLPFTSRPVNLITLRGASPLLKDSFSVFAFLKLEDGFRAVSSDLHFPEIFLLGELVAETKVSSLILSFNCSSMLRKSSHACRDLCGGGRWTSVVSAL